VWDWPDFLFNFSIGFKLESEGLTNAFEDVS
jgi:hypothetical protein